MLNPESTCSLGRSLLYHSLYILFRSPRGIAASPNIPRLEVVTCHGFNGRSTAEKVWSMLDSPTIFEDVSRLTKVLHIEELLRELMLSSI